VAFLADFHRDDSVLHPLEVRRILEPAATTMAAQVMSDEAIEELREVLEALNETDTERLIGRRCIVESEDALNPCRVRGQIAWASSVNAAATRVPGRAPTASS
jgi:DNA-binding FadR family transcriptional regulator